jgi:hypothetical protein
MDSPDQRLMLTREIDVQGFWMFKIFFSPGVGQH